MQIQIENGYPYIEFITPELWRTIEKREKEIKVDAGDTVSAGFRDEAILETCKVFTPFSHVRFQAYRSCCDYLPQDEIYSTFVTNFKEDITNQLKEIGLCQLALNKIESCFNEYTKIIKRFLNDKEALGLNFDLGTRNEIKIYEISAPLSDPHQFGSVRQITLQNNTTLIYKPRNLLSEKHWQELVCWLVENGRTRLKSAHCYCPNDEYGWMEIVKNDTLKKEEDIPEYYINMGELLFWLWLVGAKDIVRSNVIACGDKPVLVDCETIFYPQLVENKNNLTSTGALPSPQMMIDGSTSNTSAICLSGNNKTVVLLCDCKNINDLEIKYAKKNPPHAYNIPTFNDKKCYANDFHHQLKSGFVSAAKFALDKREEIYSSPLLTDFDLKTRIVLRPTVVYGNTILKILEITGRENSKFCDTILKEIPFNYRTSSFAKEKLLDIENFLLSQLTIPSFYLDNSTKNSITGIQSVFEVFIPGKLAAKQRLKNLDMEEIYNMSNEIYSSIIQN